MIRKEFALVLGLSIFLVFQYEVIPPSTIRRLSNLMAASDFEDQVRKGDLLPAELVDQTCNVMKLRFLIIGGDTATGKNVGDEKAYPNLCCNGEKIAKEGLLPSDITGCLKSMIGDRIYDVIVLDFYESADKGLDALARRLRKRFPAALIINMKKYFPGDTGFQHRTGWVWVSDFIRSITGSSDMNQQALAAFDDSGKAWTLKRDDTIQAAYEDATYNNLLWSLYKDTDAVYNLGASEIQDMLMRRAYLYGNWNLFNEDGHKDIARGIIGLCNYNVTEVTRNDTVNAWDSDAGSC